ncbi:single-stranded DNA-binding protein, partial [Nocardia salmonicida]|uniref:single-stranded DNA-binding protein n=1 Tax=Nocardia salmonicida TaxID=53431 RepID=UPI0034823324
GDAVLVTGRLRASVWQDAEGKTHQNMVVEAVSLGHDLTRGTSVFLKSGPQAPRLDDSELGALNSALSVEGPQMTSDGHIIEQEPAREVAA